MQSYTFFLIPPNAIYSFMISLHKKRSDYQCKKHMINRSDFMVVYFYVMKMFYKIAT